MKLENIVAQRPNKTIYRDGDFIIKVFDENYSKADVLNEALNQVRVEETSLLIPGVEEVTRFDGKWSIVSQYIDGKTFAQIMEENPDKTEEYINRFVDIQMDVFSKSAPLLNKLIDKLHRKISQSVDFGLDATIRYELHTRLESLPKHTKLCHGDFDPTNIIVTEVGDTYILDWSHATQGNASADVAATYLNFILGGQSTAAELYLNAFCKKSDTAKQYVQKWMPLVAASRLSRSKAEERELLVSWASVVEGM